MTTFGYHSESTSPARRRIEAPLRAIESEALNRERARTHQLERDLAKERHERQTERGRLEAHIVALEARLSPTGDRLIPAIRRIKEAVSEETHVSVFDMTSERRTGEVVRARHLGMYLASKLTNHGTPTIGSQFGGRDHTTVMSAIKQVRIRIGRDPELGELVARLTAKLTSPKGDGGGIIR